MEFGESGEAKQFLATPAREIQGRISPNGDYLAYSSDESGNYEIYIARFPDGGGKWQVSTDGGTRPRWGASGNSLYYQENNCDIAEVSVAYDPALTLGTPAIVLSCSDLGLFGGFGREFAIHPDEDRFLFSRSAVSLEENRIDVGITVVENWSNEFQP